MTAWIIRGGRVGEREQWALDNGLAGGGFSEVPDLTDATAREQVHEKVEASFPGAPAGRVSNYVGQLWAMRSLISPGDLIVMPMKTTKTIAFGICSGGYEFDASDPDLNKRHRVRVDWKRHDVTRAAFKDDLLNTINGAMTIFAARKNHGEARLRAVLEHGSDPGAGTSPARHPSTPPASTGADEAEVSEIADPNPAPTIQSIRDYVRTYLVENFGTHKLTRLIANILRIHGFVCDVSPEGPDFGVDIIAGSGPLGLDSPTLIVEVKSEQGPIGATVVRGLKGAMTSHRADQGLLVAWGGLNGPAKQELRNDRLSIRVWDSDDVLDQLFSVYDRLPDEVRSSLPLKRAWVLDVGEA